MATLDELVFYCKMKEPAGGLRRLRRAGEQNTDKTQQTEPVGKPGSVCCVVFKGVRGPHFKKRFRSFSAARGKSRARCSSSRA